MQSDAPYVSEVIKASLTKVKVVPSYQVPPVRDEEFVNISTSG